MSTAILKNLQVGSDPTATNNFTIFQPATPDGTLRIGNGNTGITSSLLTLTSAGALNVSGSFATAGNNISAVNSFGFRNRIINGDMSIDQRNFGASVTPTSSGTYTLDRWRADLSQPSKYSVQQNAGGVTPPSGFSNYLGATSLSAYTVGATEQFTLRHFIEGFNSADLGWGSSGAQSITLSFWVRSSLTGTFGGTLVNSAQDRCYGFSYTISAANTWEQKTIIIAGDTTGTWLTNNGIGIAVRFSLGSGSSSVSAAGSWGSSSFTGITGQVNLVATNGATFYITGVQLEAGTVATPFERVAYNVQFDMCRRYFERHNAATNYCNASGLSASTTQTFMSTTYYPKRATPTCTASGTVASFQLQSGGGTYASTSVPFLSVGSTTSAFLVGNTSGMVAASGSVMFLSGNATLDYSAEL